MPRIRTTVAVTTLLLAITSVPAAATSTPADAADSAESPERPESLDNPSPQDCPRDEDSDHRPGPCDAGCSGPPHIDCPCR